MGAVQVAADAESSVWQTFEALGPPNSLNVEPVDFGELEMRYDPLWHCTGYEGYYMQATKGDCDGDAPRDMEGSHMWDCHKSAQGLTKVEAALRYIELVEHIRSDPKLGGECGVCEREATDEEELLYYVQGVVEHEEFECGEENHDEGVPGDDY